jgi:hypothetical protein
MNPNELEPRKAIHRNFGGFIILNPNGLCRQFILDWNPTLLLWNYLIQAALGQKKGGFEQELVEEKNKFLLMKKLAFIRWSPRHCILQLIFYCSYHCRFFQAIHCVRIWISLNTPMHQDPQITISHDPIKLLECIATLTFCHVTFFGWHGRIFTIWDSWKEKFGHLF